MKRGLFFITFLAVLFGAAFFTGVLDRTPNLPIELNSSIVFTNERPDEDNEDILLCVPAAYSTDDGNIIGHYSVGGKRKGSADYRYTTIHLEHGTHFQQVSLVRNYRAKTFSDSRLRYRRALCKSGSQYTIVHSNLPLTLTAFAHSLTGYENAWNLDMGTYAYGWYRDDSGLHHLGSSASWNKDKQTNWIVVRKK